MDNVTERDLYDDTMDHELSRVPCTKRMRDLVAKAARQAGIPVTVYQRQAVAARLVKDGYLQRGAATN